MSSITLRLDEKGLQSLATASITGRVMTMNNNNLPNEIVLEFPQTSLSWREKNGGPNEIILYEYNILCLVENLVSLIGEGVKISVREVIEDPHT